MSEPQDAKEESSALQELGFFTQMPDMSREARFTDVRKAKFLRQTQRIEDNIRERAPKPTLDEAAVSSPPVDQIHTSALPYEPGSGHDDGARDNRIFPRFDFNRKSTALASRVYGSFYPEASREPLVAPTRLPAGAGKRLPTRQELHDQRFDELSRAIQANNRDLSSSAVHPGQRTHVRRLLS